MISFWRWFFRGSGAGPGARRFFDLWIFVHFAVGITIATMLPISLKEASAGLLLPLAGIFIGLSFAWGGNAQALLDSNEIVGLSEYRIGGLIEYVYTYQAAVLLILTSLSVWGLAGLGIFDDVWPTPKYANAYLFVSIVLFVFASMTLRECWHVVLGAQAMLIARAKLRGQKSED